MAFVIDPDVLAHFDDDGVLLQSDAQLPPRDGAGRRWQCFPARVSRACATLLRPTFPVAVVELEFDRFLARGTLPGTCGTTVTFAAYFAGLLLLHLAHGHTSHHPSGQKPVPFLVVAAVITVTIAGIAMVMACSSRHSFAAVAPMRKRVLQLTTLAVVGLFVAVDAGLNEPFCMEPPQRVRCYNELRAPFICFILTVYAVIPRTLSSLVLAFGTVIAELAMAAARGYSYEMSVPAVGLLIAVFIDSVRRIAALRESFLDHVHAACLERRLEVECRRVETITRAAMPAAAMRHLVNEALSTSAPELNFFESRRGALGICHLDELNRWSAYRRSQAVLRLLNTLFSIFDSGAACFGVEHMGTHGDQYLFAAVDDADGGTHVGGVYAGSNFAARAAAFAVWLVEVVKSPDVHRAVQAISAGLDPSDADAHPLSPLVDHPTSGFAATGRVHDATQALAIATVLTVGRMTGGVLSCRGHIHFIAGGEALREVMMTQVETYRPNMALATEALVACLGTALPCGLAYRDYAVPDGCTAPTPRLFEIYHADAESARPLSPTEDAPSTVAFAGIPFADFVLRLPSVAGAGGGAGPDPVVRPEPFRRSPSPGGFAISVEMESVGLRSPRNQHQGRNVHQRAKAHHAIMTAFLASLPSPQGSASGRRRGTALRSHHDEASNPSTDVTRTTSFNSSKNGKDETVGIALLRRFRRTSVAGDDDGCNPFCMPSQPSKSARSDKGDATPKRRAANVESLRFFDECAAQRVARDAAPIALSVSVVTGMMVLSYAVYWLFYVPEEINDPWPGNASRTSNSLMSLAAVLSIALWWLTATQIELLPHEDASPVAVSALRWRVLLFGALVTLQAFVTISAGFAAQARVLRAVYGALCVVYVFPLTAALRPLGYVSVGVVGVVLVVPSMAFDYRLYDHNFEELAPQWMMHALVVALAFYLVATKQHTILQAMEAKEQLATLRALSTAMSALKTRLTPPHTRGTAVALLQDALREDAAWLARPPTDLLLHRLRSPVKLGPVDRLNCLLVIIKFNPYARANNAAPAHLRHQHQRHHDTSRSQQQHADPTEDPTLGSTSASDPSWLDSRPALGNLISLTPARRQAAAAAAVADHHHQHHEANTRGSGANGGWVNDAPVVAGLWRRLGEAVEATSERAAVDMRVIKVYGDILVVAGPMELINTELYDRHCQELRLNVDNAQDRLDAMKLNNTMADNTAGGSTTSRTGSRARRVQMATQRLEAAKTELNKRQPSAQDKWLAFERRKLRSAFLAAMELTRELDVVMRPITFTAVIDYGHLAGANVGRNVLRYQMVGPVMLRATALSYAVPTCPRCCIVMATDECRKAAGFAPPPTSSSSPPGSPQNGETLYESPPSPNNPTASSVLPVFGPRQRWVVGGGRRHTVFVAAVENASQPHFAPTTDSPR